MFHNLTQKSSALFFRPNSFQMTLILENSWFGEPITSLRDQIQMADHKSSLSGDWNCRICLHVTRQIHSALAKLSGMKTSTWMPLKHRKLCWWEQESTLKHFSSNIAISMSYVAWGWPTGYCVSFPIFSNACINHGVSCATFLWCIVPGFLWKNTEPWWQDYCWFAHQEKPDWQQARSDMFYQNHEGFLWCKHDSEWQPNIQCHS